MISQSNIQYYTVYLYILFYCGDLNAVILKLIISYFSCPILHLHVQT